MVFIARNLAVEASISKESKKIVPLKMAAALSAIKRFGVWNGSALH